MPRSLLACLLLVLVSGCDQTTQYTEPFEVVLYLQSGATEREVLRREVPRSAVQQAPISVPIPRTATGFLARADVSIEDSLVFVGVARPERFDIYDLPRGFFLRGGQASVTRGPGGSFLPLLLFSTDSLWTGPRASAGVEVAYGTTERRRDVSREEAVVSEALSVRASELGLSDLEAGRIELRAEVLGARGVNLVPVLLSRNSDSAILPNQSPIQTSVFVRDPGNADRYYVPLGEGVVALTDFQADDAQVFSVVLLRAD